MGREWSSEGPVSSPGRASCSRVCEPWSCYTACEMDLGKWAGEQLHRHKVTCSSPCHIGSWPETICGAQQGQKQGTQESQRGVLDSAQEGGG